MPWYVLYTKPRNEKKTAKLLEAKDVEVYCPLQEIVKQWSDRKKKISEPVFRSYIFVKLEAYEQEQTAVLETPGAVRFLWWQKKPGIVRDEEITEIRNFLERYKGVSLTVNFAEGDTVTVADGPFREQTGNIVRIKRKTAVLELKSLGWNIVAELPLQAIKKQPK